LGKAKEENAARVSLSKKQEIRDTKKGKLDDKRRRGARERKAKLQNFLRLAPVGARLLSLSKNVLVTFQSIRRRLK